MRILCAFLLSIAALAGLQSVTAWGPSGHTAVAAVADSILATNCQQCGSRAREILGGSSFEDVATWADDIRSQQEWKWTSSLHFVDTPDWACNFNYQQDCADNMCVVGALNNFTKTAMAGGDWSIYAMKFIVHFVGDVHQPMHVSFTSDRGGNNIKGVFEGKTGNLHQVWDSTIIDKHIREDFQGSQKNYENFILSRITGEWSQDVKSWATCPSGSTICADVWASETGALVCTNGYKDAQGNVIPNNYHLGDDYYDMNKNVVDRQVAKAAVRLAALAERMFGSSMELESNEYLSPN